MLITGRTDKGIRRRNNQDCFAAGEIAGGCYAVVCDGIGGQRGGEVASRMACDHIAGAIRRGFTSHVQGDARDAWVRGTLELAAREANELIYEAGGRNDDLAGMGTTLVAAVIIGDTAYILHAGDSRAYLINGGKMSRITTDHTMVQVLIERGEITESEGREHPQRNYITRALGVAPRMNCTFTVIPLGEGDNLLICTDGLYGYVDAEEFEPLAVRAVRDASVDALIQAANDGGGGDNITAVIIGRGEVAR